jgi:hypothetical protein
MWCRQSVISRSSKRVFYHSVVALQLGAIVCEVLLIVPGERYLATIVGFVPNKHL